MRVKYTGKKNNYGPLKMKWMLEPVYFADNISEPIDGPTARAIIDTEPKIFEIYQSVPVAEPKIKISAGTGPEPEIDIVEEPKPKPKPKPKKKTVRKKKAKAKPKSINKLIPKSKKG